VSFLPPDYSVIQHSVDMRLIFRQNVAEQQQTKLPDVALRAQQASDMSSKVEIVLKSVARFVTHQRHSCDSDLAR
jgi:hypothetical protein